MTRDDDIAAAYKKGLSLAEVGEEFALTRERVRQILKKRGILRRPTGQGNKNTEAVFGCSRAEFDRIKNLDARIPHKYTRQRSLAKRRGIGWAFTLPTWWAVWERSGAWGLRGTGKWNSPVMARTGDKGPYAPDNVRITTSAENLKEAVEVRFGGNSSGASLNPIFPMRLKPVIREILDRASAAEGKSRKRLIEDLVIAHLGGRYGTVQERLSRMGVK